MTEHCSNSRAQEIRVPFHWSLEMPGERAKSCTFPSVLKNNNDNEDSNQTKANQTKANQAIVVTACELSHS